MKDEFDELEILWGNLLSREAEQVRIAFLGLEPGEQQSVVAHLRRMTTETGWHPEQRASAQAALVILEEQSLI